MPIDEVREKIISAVENIKKQISGFKDDYEKIKATQKTLDLLNDFLAGKISFLETEALSTTYRSCTLIIKEHEVIIKEHENRKAQIKERLENIALLWSFIEPKN